LEKALFISDKLFLEKRSKFSGGVKLCTLEYLELSKLLFNCEIIEIENKLSLFSRLKIKFKIDTYNFYDKSNLSEIETQIINNNIKWVLLNMSNLIGIGGKLKNKFPHLKIILLSHGNESGDYLHEVTRFKSNSLFQFIKSYKLGRLLQIEAEARLKTIDFVFTVSPVEAEIEKWLNAKKVFYIPRTIKLNFLKIKPELKKIGFIGDLSHFPNIDAINKLSKEMLKQKMFDYQLCIIGKPEKIGEELAAKYSFIKYLGYLNDDDVIIEISTWAAFLNILFYYSRGVSTKLGFALSNGLPVINTIIATRGYEYKSEEKLICSNNQIEICILIKEYCSTKLANENLIKRSREVASSSFSMTEIASSIKVGLNLE
jgi:hypothetical protein